MKPYLHKVNFAILGIACGATLVCATPSMAAPMINIDFDTGYTTGQTYTANLGTNTGNLTGSQPSHFGSFSAAADSVFTATVGTVAGVNSTNQLIFNLPAGTGDLNIAPNAYVGSFAGNNTGTWELSFNYTPISGPSAARNTLRNFSLATIPGYNSIGAQNGYGIFNNAVGATTLTLGTQYLLSEQVDLGTNVAGNIRFYLNGTLISTNAAPIDLTGKTVNGFIMTLGFPNALFPNATSFALDNIVVTQVVPEPSTAGILACAGLGFAFFGNRRKRSLNQA